MSTKKTKAEDKPMRDFDNLPEDKVLRTPLPSKTLKDMLTQFIRCLNAKYIHTDNDGDYAI